MDKKEFKDTIDKVSHLTGIQTFIIEKDYHLTCLLERIVSKVPSIIIKGGTSLSKCFHIINRFSEDIDLNVLVNGLKVTKSIRRLVNKAIIESIEELSYKLTNKEDIKSRMDYNKYTIDYNPIYDILGLRQYIIIETAYNIKSYPVEKKNVKSLIEEKANTVVSQKSFHLPMVNIYSQNLVRTFIDKLFAICDYYINNKYVSHSRHLYDIFMIYPYISFDNDFYALFNEIKELRKNHPYSYTIKTNKGIIEIITEIINSDYYKNDYNNITSKLLFDNVSYNDCIKTLNIIIETMRLFI